MPMPAVAPDLQKTPLAEAMDAGIAMATGQEKTREADDVKRWWTTICTTLAFDSNARRMYVRCRRYARGDSGFVVDANIPGTNIDILESFIYAKNPDVDVTPSKSVEVPALESMIEAAMLDAEEDPELNKQVEFAVAAAQLTAQQEGKDPAQVGEVVRMQVKQALVAEKAQANLAKIKETYGKLRREAKQFAETLELVISRMWKDAGLKDRGRPFVRSALTIGPGILKASWQERTKPSPETLTAINDLVGNLERVKALRVEIEDEAAGANLEANYAELQRQLDALRGKAEEVVSRGYVIANVAGENFLVAPGFRIADHANAPWNAERIPMAMCDIVAKFKLSKAEQAQVTKYTARKPVMQQPESANADGLMDVIDPKLAEDFVQGEPATVSDTQGSYGAGQLDDGPGGGAGCFGMVWEIWNKDDNHVLTMIEGLTSRWAKPAWIPPTTTRFYPFFLFCTSEVDGQRHPQSPTERSAKLVDEYNRIGSAEATHRRRILPKTIFNAGDLPEAEARKIEKGTIQEMVAIKTTVPGKDLRSLIFPITYAAIDVALYDRSRINAEIERIWGVQEALGGSATVDKTATQVEVEQQGFQARTGSRRDSLEDTMSHMALYTAEIARAFLDYEAVKDIAGPNALWPEYEGPADLRRMVNVDIKAGTTGKPNTRAERESWSMVMPHLQAAIQQYAQLTGSSPLDVAESVKKLAQITAERAGERLDLDSLFPPAGQGPMLPAVDGKGKPIEGGAPKAPGAPSEGPPQGPGAPMPNTEPAVPA
jgi:hypothetical protein